MKKLTKEKKEKLLKIKSILVKVVNITCYICTALFLITLLISICNSSNTTASNTHNYDNKSLAVREVPHDQQAFTTKANNQVIKENYYYFNPLISFERPLLYDVDNNEIEVPSGINYISNVVAGEITAFGYTYNETTYTYYMVINETDVYDIFTYDLSIGTTHTKYIDPTIMVRAQIYVPLNVEVSYDLYNFFYKVFVVNEPYSIYNSVFINQSMILKGLPHITVLDACNSHYLLNTLIHVGFTSGPESYVYNSIRSSVYARKDADGAYRSIYYDLYYDDTLVYRNTLLNVIGSPGSYIDTYVLDNSSWVASYYSKIIITKDFGLMIDDFITYYDDVSITPTTMVNYDVYVVSTLTDSITLIRIAFSSLIPLLSLSIFPNITLGILILIPFVIGFLIWLIHLVTR